MQYLVFTCIFSCAHQNHASDPWEIPWYASCTISSYAMSLNTSNQNAGSHSTYEGIYYIQPCVGDIDCVNDSIFYDMVLRSYTTFSHGLRMLFHMEYPTFDLHFVGINIRLYHPRA